jgi:hypothetical protein
MGRSQSLIDRRVYIDLFENSVVSGRVPYRRSVERGWISYDDLIQLARIADVPHPLFFAPYDVVRAQIDMKTAKLLQGVGKETFSLNSRDSVKVSDVELIIKDLTRKQMLLRNNDDSLQDNPIVGLLRRSRGTAEDAAAELLDALELGPTTIREAGTKMLALDVLTRHLEAKQVLVSRSVRGFRARRTRRARPRRAGA